MSSSFPDYYKVLEVKPGANESDIRQAYKVGDEYPSAVREQQLICACRKQKQSLIHHPDRLKNPTEKERVSATEKFQTVADAYYVLSDKARRRAYDNQRAAHQEVPGGYSADNSGTSSANFFNSFFGQGGPGYAHADEDAASSAGSESARPDANFVFTDVFDDLLAPEVDRVVPFWRWTGAAAGAVMGFIVGNLPGAAIGAYGGGKVGQIRDAKGKAVATVFMGLGSDQRYAILQGLLSKIMAQVKP
ncbi:MAG: hypothetical protein CYPHOPRED_004580 [Cyphobasidiales sp. Tagirdzhanova-0007]|nr:MAG: hypothetical protein CYPHOPRED_004580 [Cyphobasidiales sp. Tagirdzhanova-0007]